VLPETGRTGDDLVPVIDSFDFLSHEEKVRILNTNPGKVVTGLLKVGK